MLSRNQIKLIQSLNRKKSRDESGLFLVEGTKMVEEALISGYRIHSIISTSEFKRHHFKTASAQINWIESDPDTLRKASLQQNPQDAMAIVYKPEQQTDVVYPEVELYLVLDFIQDPGNLGTILRVADWFGIKTVICSENTVDCYNPKVVQASMGAIFRVNTFYTDLQKFIPGFAGLNIPVYGTFLEGKNIYAEKLTPNGFLILGNEGNGISASVENLVTRKLFIPRFTDTDNQPESLNVAIAAAICCSEFRRR